MWGRKSSGIQQKEKKRSLPWKSYGRDLNSIFQREKKSRGEKNMKIRIKMTVLYNNNNKQIIIPLPHRSRPARTWRSGRP